ncbi:UDP-glucose/GDP-mannose dehydrogenase family protein [Gammaproteobacteria bacterium]|nr:UDP-glucose/GDP-mannose dehydrogenase family protein [Gammaproteobacteria bacterium]
MKISIIGTGYVGLVTGSCFAEIGHSVTCLDIDKNRVRKLKMASIPFYEPGLKSIVQQGLKKKQLTFTTLYPEACKNADAIFICVGTPCSKTGKPNLRFIKDVIKSLATTLNTNTTIFIKSTVPVGTTSAMKKFFKRVNKNNLDISFASNPEFLKEGSAVNDFKSPDRIIIGTESLKVQEISNNIYNAFNHQRSRILFTSIESSELIKYASNSFLATKISFINEIARLADALNANIDDVRRGMGADSRIGSSFLYSGLGYGGSCFPKDIDGLIDQFKENQLEPSLLEAVKKINTSQYQLYLEKIYEIFPKHELMEMKIHVWGSSFKPETDDIRESISLKLIRALSNKVKKIFIYDPVALKNTKIELSDLNNLVFVEDKYSHINQSNVLILATEWKEFWDPDIQKLQTLKSKTVVDGRNILSRKKLEAGGINYLCIAR